MRYRAMEYVGVGLIAGALFTVSWALAAGAIGIYLLVVGVLLGGDTDGSE